METSEEIFEICSKLIINMPQREQWHRSNVFIFKLEEISQRSGVLIDDFEQLSAG